MCINMKVCSHFIVRFELVLAGQVMNTANPVPVYFGRDSTLEIYEVTSVPTNRYYSSPLNFLQFLLV